MSKVYLAGAITGSSYHAATDWRFKTVEDLKAAGVVGLSPLRGKYYLSKEEEIQDSYSNHTMSSVDGINIRDYNDCRTCDAILVNLLGTTKVSIGTVMEVAWGRAFNKPIVLVMEKGNIHEHSMFTYGVIREETLDNGVAAIIQLLSA